MKEPATRPQPAQDTTAAPDPRTRGVTVRAVALGLLLMPLNAYWITQMAVVRYSGHATTVSLFFNCVFALLVLMVINLGLRRLRARWALAQQELLVVYIMLVMASSLVSHDMVQVVTPQISHAVRFADGANKWEELFFDYLPDFMILRDETALKGAYEGGTTLYLPEHYRPWLRPVAHWCGFLVVLVFVMLCLNALFRRRWTDDEKLSYPIAQIPVELSRPAGALYRDRGFQVCLCIAAGISLINGLHEFYPAIPLIKTRVVHYDAMMRDLFTDRPWIAFRGMRLSFYPFAIGLGYLLPVDLLFSCCFFYWAAWLQRLVGVSTGWQQIPHFPWIREQAFGSYIGLSLFAFWIARPYLRQLGRLLVGRPSTLDESREPLPYRLAALGVIAGCSALVWFAHHIGMSIWVALIFFAVYWMLSVAVTRIRAELGPPAHDLHHAGPDQFLQAVFGSEPGGRLGDGNLTAMKMMFWFNRAYRAHPMPCHLEAMKIGSLTQMPQRRLWVVVLLATMVGSVCAFWAQLHCYYVYGMSARMHPVATIFGREPYTELAQWIGNPDPTDWPRIGAMVFGFAVTFLLNSLRMQFPWFPFHPVGYAISTSWSLNVLWMPLLLAYIAKSLVIRYGGYPIYRRTAPCALGLIVGEFMMGSFWTIYGIARQVPTYGFWV